MRSVKINVYGTVQGVFFRQFLKDKADEIGVRGIVRNLENGSVEAYIEGVDDKVKEIVSAIKKGPPNSKIKDIKIQNVSYQGFVGFKISHL
jgi:acylphosphatase